MSSNEKYQSFIIPKLQEFWKNHRDDYMNSGLSDGLYIPYAFDRYDNCEKKIFYIGQDAPYWIKAHCMSALFDENNIQQYIRLNNDGMRPIKKRLAWGNQTSFWTMVVKTHLYLTTNVWHNDIYKISESDKNLLDTIGWGNVHFIPLRQTITRYGGGDVQPQEYNAVDNALKDFNYLQVVVEKFAPDTIVILTKMFDSERYYRGLNIRWWTLPSNIPTRLIQVGDIITKTKSTRLIRVYNPTYYKFCGTNMHDVADLIRLYA